jgi:hypothetical protein
MTTSQSLPPSADSLRLAPRHVAVDVVLSLGREDAAEPVRQALQAIAPFVAAGTVAQQDAVFRNVVDGIIAATPIRSLDAARAALEQRAIAAIFAGTEWLTADQVGRLRDPDAKNPHGTANRWRSEGKVFALTKGGVLYYPRYAFDEVLDPYPAVAEVLSALAGYSPYRVASWFESTNSHLGGARPRERLARDPLAVIATALEHVAGPAHG